MNGLGVWWLRLWNCSPIGLFSPPEQLLLSQPLIATCPFSPFMNTKEGNREQSFDRKELQPIVDTSQVDGWRFVEHFFSSIHALRKRGGRSVKRQPFKIWYRKNPEATSVLLGNFQAIENCRSTRLPSKRQQPFDSKNIKL